MKNFRWRIFSNQRMTVVFYLLSCWMHTIDIVYEGCNFMNDEPNKTKIVNNLEQSKKNYYKYSYIQRVEWDIHITLVFNHSRCKVLVQPISSTLFHSWPCVTICQNARIYERSIIPLIIMLAKAVRRFRHAPVPWAWYWSWVYQCLVRASSSAYSMESKKIIMNWIVAVINFRNVR